MKAVVDGEPVQVEGQPVQVYFNYGEGELDLIQGPTTVRQVECVIRPFPVNKDENPEPFAVGLAQCSPLDNFDKSKGRFLAWKRAVQESDKFTRDQRRQLWQWFTSACRLPSETTF